MPTFNNKIPKAGSKTKQFGYKCEISDSLNFWTWRKIPKFGGGGIGTFGAEILKIGYETPKIGDKFQILTGGIYTKTQKDEKVTDRERD